MNSWPIKKMSEVTCLVTDGKHGDCEDDPNSGYFFLSSKDLRDGKLHYDNPRQIKHADFLETHRRTNLQPGDILLTNCGASIGRVGSAQNDPRIRRTTFQKSISVIKPDKEVVDGRYLYYFLLANCSLLIHLGGGTAQPNLLISDLKRIAVPVPARSVQRRIAAILSAYDELVENSQRRIRILEAIARVLYQESLQETGGVTSGKSILETDYWKLIPANVSPYEGTKRYYATADVEALTIEGQGIDYTFAEKPSRAQKQPTPYSVWFARMKDTYKIAWYSDVNSQSAQSSILSSGFAGLQALETSYFPLLFLTVSSQEFHAQKDLFCTGATQMSLTNEGLARIAVPLPSETAARRLGAHALPLLNHMLVLELRIQNLRRTRDLMLPRLMSGEIAIDISSLEQAAA